MKIKSEFKCQNSFSMSVNKQSVSFYDNTITHSSIDFSAKFENNLLK